MNCCRKLEEAFAAVAKERDELKRTLAQREKELKGANAACGELMGKVEELQAENKNLLARLQSWNKIPYAERKEVYSDARTLYGSKRQCMKAIEGMSELTKEISKGWFECKNLDGVIEEIADVTIMMEQLRLIFGINDKVCAVMDEKVARLREQIAQDAK